MVSFSSPRRSTISAFRAVSPPPNLPMPVSQKPGVCTHMTVTRLYTSGFSCSICHSVGTMGWVYRCTQDRELLIDSDLEMGYPEKVDDLWETLEISAKPKKRSPGARAEPLSLFDEITDEQLATYTPAQLATILKQREHLQSVLASTDVLRSQSHQQCHHDVEAQSPFDPDTLSNTSQCSSDTPFQFLPTPSPLKPWMPLKECQFKACARCRPSFRDKSYMSLNSIVNGDIPGTASMGFGFHMLGSRPVVNVELVKNLGLRPNPTPRSHRRSNSREPVESYRRYVEDLCAASSGLGISANEVEQSSVPDSITRPRSPMSVIFSTDAIASSLSSSWPSSTMLADQHHDEGDEDKENEPQPREENAMSGISAIDFAFHQHSPAPRERRRPRRRLTGYPLIVVTSEYELERVTSTSTSGPGGVLQPDQASNGEWHDIALTTVKPSGDENATSMAGSDTVAVKDGVAVAEEEVEVEIADAPVRA